MDFAQRSNSAPTGAPAPNRAPESKKSRRMGSKMGAVMRWGTVTLLVSGTILVVALVAMIGVSKTSEQSKYVNSGQYQAVFLNGGQVYFGKITSLNQRYVAMSDIYYLRVNQAVQPTAQQSDSSNDVSLVKLGCELHGPQDQMVINSDQIVFWENLKTDGQVAKAVAEYQKQNPKGQDCSAAAASTQTPATTPAATPKQ
ncbi:MAG: hypothetical protein ABIQ89_02500 [Candidatus Saccharimonadales bacterium]